jgi:hypothetical protein
MREALAAHLRTHNVARIIYGSIIGLALVVALEQHPPSAGAIVATLLGTALAVAVAEIYSDVIGTEVRTRARISRRHLSEVVEDAALVAFGIAFPAVFFLLAAFEAIERDTAFTLARWTGLFLIAAYGFAAARLAGMGLSRSLVQAVAIGLVGAFVILLHAVTH